MGVDRALHLELLPGTLLALAVVSLLLTSSIGSDSVEAASGVITELHNQPSEVQINYSRIDGQENTDYTLRLPKESNVLSASVNLTGDYIFKENQITSYKTSQDWRNGVISKDGDTATLIYDTDGLHLDMDTLAPFWPGEKKAVGNNAYDVITADFNNDRKDDFATANLDSDSLTIYYQDAQGKFTSKSTVSTSDAPKTLATGDFNNDDRLDIAVGCEAGSCVDFLTQRAAGGFDRTSYSVGKSVIGLVSGDFNGDGLDDVTAATDSFYAYVITQKTTGGFETSTTITAGETLWGYYPMNIRDVASADFNKDGMPDLVFTICYWYGWNWEYQYYGLTKIYYQGSSGSFSSYTSWYSGTGSWNVEAGDVSGDGRADVIVSKIWVNTVKVYYYSSSGGWGSSSSGLTGGNEVHRGAIADFDGDGKNDLALATSSPALMFYKQEDGALSSMAKKFELPSGSNGRAVAAGRLDQTDGFVDAVTADGEGNSAHVYRQRLTYDGVYVSTPIVRPLPIRYINFTSYIRPGGGETTFFFSVDGGLNWTEIVNATVYDLVNRTDTIWFKVTFHAVSASKYDGLREFRMNMTYQSYPADLVLDMGDDNQVEWNITGELIGTTAVLDLAEPLTAYVQNGTHYPDGTGYVSIPIMVYSGTPGTLRISDLYILFNNASRPSILPKPTDNAFVNATPTFQFLSNDTDDDLLMFKLQITKTDFMDAFNTMTFDMNKDLFNELEGQGFSAASFRQGTVGSFRLPDFYKLEDNTVYRWRVFAFDGFLWSRSSPVYTMKVDSIFPIGHASSPKYATSLEFTVSWSAEDQMPGSGLSPVGTYDVQSRKSTETLWSDWLAHTTLTSANYTGEEGATYYFRMRARDGVWNEQLYIGGKGDTQTTIDTIVPTVSWGQMPNFQDTRSFLMRWIASDYVPGSGIKYYEVQLHKEAADWSTWLSEFRSVQAVFQADSDTSYTFRVMATDNANNRGPWSEDFTVRIDATPPIMTTQPKVPLQEGFWQQLGRLVVNFTYADPESGVRSAEVGIGTDKGMFDVLSPTSFPYPASGSLAIASLELTNSQIYYVGVHAENFAGAWSEWVWSDEFMVAIPGPVSTISYPTGTVVDPRVTINISSTDPREYNITLGDLRMRYATRAGEVWTWSDWERVSNARTDTLFEGKRGFRYQFMFRAQNELGSWGPFWTPLEEQWFFVNNPPVANGGPAKVSTTGRDVQFSADESTDRDADTLTYKWEFGDGERAEGLYVSHSYAKSGLYTVTLTVSDGNEASVARTTVYIEAEEKAPGFGAATAVLGLVAGLAIAMAASGLRRRT